MNSKFLAFAAAAVLAPATALASTGSEKYAFNVLLDGDAIGSHVFEIDRNDGATRVQSNASFDVDVLFVPVFSYRHSNEEVWRDGCLAQIDSETDSNGRQYRVDGMRVDDGYRIETAQDERRYAASCLMSFAYWDPAIVEQDRLLNAQTGELVEVEVEPLGRHSLSVQGREIPVEGYHIATADAEVDIRVYYHGETRRWVALESTLKNGRVMRYEPDPDVVLAALAPEGAR
jgi:hypothetical protein